MKSYSRPAVRLARKYGVPWLFNHPFLDNAAPWWQSVDAVGSARISSKRETSSKCVPAIPSFPFRWNNLTYHRKTRPCSAGSRSSHLRMPTWAPTTSRMRPRGSHPVRCYRVVPLPGSGPAHHAGAGKLLAPVTWTT